MSRCCCFALPSINCACVGGAGGRSSRTWKYPSTVTATTSATSTKRSGVNFISFLCQPWGVAPPGSGLSIPRGTPLTSLFDLALVFENDGPESREKNPPTPHSGLSRYQLRELTAV